MASQTRTRFIRVSESSSNSIQAGYPDKGCPAFCRYKGLQQTAHLVFFKHRKWLFLARPNDNKPVFRYSYNASIKLDSCAAGGTGGVRRFSHKLHHNMPGRPENGSACFISAALIRTTSLAFRSLLGRASSIRATCQNVSCQGGFSCYNEPDIRSKLNRMNQE